MQETEEVPSAPLEGNGSRHGHEEEEKTEVDDQNITNRAATNVEKEVELENAAVTEDVTPVAPPPTLEQIEVEELAKTTKPSGTPSDQAMDNKSSSSSSSQRSSPRWKYIVIGLIILLILVVAMLAMVVYWLRQERLDNNLQETGVLGGDGDGGMSSSTSSPVEPPLNSPKQFMPLAIDPNAILLSRVSECDDCEEEVVLPFEFMWLGRVPITRIFVSSNGIISIRNTSPQVSCCGVINVASADLNPSLIRGGIWILPIIKNTTLATSEQRQQMPTSPFPNALVVSWEKIPFYNGGDSTVVNAQATLYPSGNIDLCWGEGVTGGNNIYAAITDVTPNSKFPATSDPFGDSGQTQEGNWPTNQCRSFIFTSDDSNGDDIPSSTMPVSITAIPSTAPTLIPQGTGDGTCRPTVGVCMLEFQQLLDTIWDAREEEVISICEGAEILAEFPIEVRQDSITLCCTGPPCFIMSGSDRILQVYGENFKLQGISFSGGSTPEGGGNVLIDAGGNHRITNCTFWEAKAELYGGHLNVRNADSVVIAGSSFMEGGAIRGGGAVSIEDCGAFFINSSVFEFNSGDLGGAIFSSSLEGSEVVYSITNSTFRNNWAEYGGAFLATTLGEMPKLIVYNCTFIENEASNNGGVAAVFHHQEEGTVDLRLNRGSRNGAFGGQMESCDDFALFYGVDRFCARVDEDFSYPAIGSVSPLPRCPMKLQALTEWYVTEDYNSTVSSIAITLNLQLLGSSSITEIDIQLWTIPSLFTLPVSFEPLPPVLVHPSNIFMIRFVVDLDQAPDSEQGLAFRIRSAEYGTMRPELFRVISVVFECVVDSLNPSIAPSTTPGVYPGHCSSTTGDLCISNFTSLRIMLARARPGDTIALCGNPIYTEDGPLIIEAENVTLCCADVNSAPCEIRGFHKHQNLIVTGANSTLQGLLFRDGMAEGNGGNVEIKASGYHRIIRCEFVNGTATNYGGNLAVFALGVVVEHSVFVLGRGLSGGGGSFLEVKESAVVSTSLFESNIASNLASTGGGLTMFGARRVVVEQSSFVENTADWGGGLFVSHLGSFSSLEVLSCDFESNVAVQRGGPAAIVAPKLSSTIVVRKSNGGGNVALNSTCTEGLDLTLTQAGGNNTYVCIGLDESFRQISDNVPSPAPTSTLGPTDPRSCPSELIDQGDWYEAAFNNVNRISVNMTLRNLLETSISNVTVLVAAMPFGTILTPSVQTQNLAFVDVGASFSLVFIVDVSNLPDEPGALRIFPSSFEYQRMPASSFNLEFAVLECSPLVQWVEVGLRTGSSDGTAQVGSSVSLAENRLAFAPFHRASSEDGIISVATIVAPRDSGVYWAEEGNGGLLVADGNPFGFTQREPVGNLVSLSRGSGTLVAVRYGRLATVDGKENVGTLQLFACCGDLVQGDWAPVGQTLGGTTETESIDFVALADKEPWFIVFVKDRTRERGGRYQVFSLGVDLALSQVGQDIEGGPNPSQSFGRFDKAAIAYDGQIIAVGVETNLSDLSCRAVRTYYYSNGLFEPFGQADINLGLEDCLEHGESGGYNLALSYGGDYLAVASANAGGENQGVVRIFHNGFPQGEAGEWEQVGQDIVGTTRNGLFGFSIVFDKTGSRVAIGSPVYDGSDDKGPLVGINIGKVDIFEIESSSWSLVSQLYGTDEFQRFGSSLSFSLDGRRLAVGSPGWDGNAGQVQVFEMTL